MRVRRTENDHIAGIVIHIVLYERSLAGYQLRSIHLRHHLSDCLEMRPEFRRYLCFVFTCRELLLYELSGQIVLLISGVTNEYAGKNILYVFS